MGIHRVKTTKSAVWSHSNRDRILVDFRDSGERAEGCRKEPISAYSHGRARHVCGARYDWRLRVFVAAWRPQIAMSMDARSFKLPPRRFTIAGLALALLVTIFYLSCTERAARTPQPAAHGAANPDAAQPASPQPSPADATAVTLPARQPVYAIWVARSQYQTPEDV